MARTATLIMPGCAVASSTAAARRAPAERNAREVFERFVDLLYRRQQVRAAFEICVAPQGYRDHVATGSGSRSQAMSVLAPKLGAIGPRIELLHTVFDGDIGMVHLQVLREAPLPPAPRVEIFRVADGRIVEHWSVAA